MSREKEIGCNLVTMAQNSIYSVDEIFCICKQVASLSRTLSINPTKLIRLLEEYEGKVSPDMVYAVYRKGVYGQGIYGIYDSIEKAGKACHAALAYEYDEYHHFEVVPIELNCVYDVTPAKSGCGYRNYRHYDRKLFAYGKKGGKVVPYEE